MKSSNHQMFCITGYSRLSEERVVITPPCSRDTAEKILKREMAKPAKKRYYLRMKLSSYPPRLNYTYALSHEK